MQLNKRGQAPPGRRRSMDADGGAVTYELRGRVAWVGLNRPNKRNAINDALLRELLAAARRAQEEARALLLRRPRPVRAPRPRPGGGVPPLSLLARGLRRAPPRPHPRDRGAARR